MYSTSSPLWQWASSTDYYLKDSAYAIWHDFDTSAGVDYP
jgi:hypothetical protein